VRWTPLESDLERLLRELIREELVGTLGGVRLYQMGGSLPDELYNLDDRGRPTRDPGLAGLRRSRRRKKNKKSDS
jgi:hypothetical protein